MMKIKIGSGGPPFCRPSLTLKFRVSLPIRSYATGCGGRGGIHDGSGDNGGGEKDDGDGGL
jgi:hypothetical protein